VDAGPRTVALAARGRPGRRDSPRAGAWRGALSLANRDPQAPRQTVVGMLERYRRLKETRERAKAANARSGVPALAATRARGVVPRVVVETRSADPVSRVRAAWDTGGPATAPGGIARPAWPEVAEPADTDETEPEVAVAAPVRERSPRGPVNRGNERGSEAVSPAPAPAEEPGEDAAPPLRRLSIQDIDRHLRARL
jgi:hypothetical protein